GAAENRGEQVVEIVGDAPGELAHGLHFLGLAQLVLEVAALVMSRASTKRAGAPARVIGCASTSTSIKVPSLRRCRKPVNVPPVWLCSVSSNRASSETGRMSRTVIPRNSCSE